MSIFDKSLNIVVLAGGVSDEREVSLLSGRAVTDALMSRGHNVRMCDISPTDSSVLDAGDIDAVFIALHGYFGEDGHVQRLCQQRGLPYTGSASKACELAMDKAAAKQIFAKAGLDTPKFAVLEQFDSSDKHAAQLADIPEKCVVKPILGGSSQDVFIIKDAARRDSAISYTLDRYTRTMVEEFIAGREFTVAVLGDQALDALEIVTDSSAEFYDFNAKYEDDATEFIFDSLDSKTSEKMRQMALQAHNVLGCRDMSRADFRLDSNNRPWILEVNVIPGLTDHSLLPKSAARAGIDFATMCERLIEMAISR